MRELKWTLVGSVSGWNLIACSALICTTCNHNSRRATEAAVDAVTTIDAVDASARQPANDSPFEASTAASPVPQTASTEALTATSPAQKPTVPNIQLHDEASSSSEFQLEETGFPALSKDGSIVALAFHELQDSGPPALELTVQFRSATSGNIVYESGFREPYKGELGKAYLEALKHRVHAWLSRVQRKLALADLVTMSPTVHDEAAVCSDNPEPIRVPGSPLEVRFNAGRLVVRGESSRVLFDHAYPEWTTTYSIQGEHCVFLPYVSQVSFDAPHELLVIRATHCSPSDMCTKRVLPKFAVIPLRPAASH